jgi:hypothetical protein
MAAEKGCIRPFSFLRQATIAGAPTAGTTASGPSPFFYTKITKTLARGRARHARFQERNRGGESQPDRACE